MHDIEADGGPRRDPWQLAPYTSSSAPDSPFDPVRGVSLKVFAEIAEELASCVEPGVRGIDLAAEHGIRATDWVLACRTWNQRIASEPAVAHRFVTFGRRDAHDLAS